jgi:cytochrome P450
MAWLRRARHTDPVQCDPRGNWHVFGYAEAADVLSNYADFSNVVTDVPSTSALKVFGRGNLAWLDPPRHRQLRSLVNGVFSARYTAGLEPMVTAITEEFFDKVRHRDTVAFIDGFAFPIMLTSIARMVGIPHSEYRLFGRWLKALLAITEVEAQNLMKVFASLTREMDRCLHGLIEDRRRDPRDDLITQLVSARVEGETVDDDELAGLIALLVATGEVGATQTLANAVICLDRYPDVAARLRSDATLLDSAIEEVMRYRNQTIRVDRRTTRAVVLGGHEIPAGQHVSVWLTSANRDERRFADPDTFDIDRSPNPHMAFGKGIHFCVGAPLARLQVKVVLGQLLRETTHLSIDHANSRFLDPRMLCGAGEISLKVAWRTAP